MSESEAKYLHSHLSHIRALLAEGNHAFDDAIETIGRVHESPRELAEVDVEVVCLVHALARARPWHVRGTRGDRVKNTKF